MRVTQQPGRLRVVFSGILLIAVCILTGCSPKDPLDRTVDASDPGTFSNWWNHEQPRLPPALAAELNDAFYLLENATPRLQAVDFNASNDRFCVKVNRLRLRDVLIDAGLEQNRILLQNISRETNNLEKMMGDRFDEATGNAALRRDWVIKQEQEKIQEWKTQLEKNQARIDELKTPSAR